jgi:uncharacterized protein (TIGR02145 family)
MKRFYSTTHLLLPVLVFIALILSTCEKPERDNPWDAKSKLSPGAWAPQNFKSERVDLTSVKLSWTYGDHHIEGFRIDRKKGYGEWQESYAVLEKDQYSYTDQGLDFSNNVYRYRHYAFAGENISEKNELYISLPVLSTTQVTGIKSTSALGGGNITDGGGLTVTARGVVWSNQANTTLENNKGFTNDGSGVGQFTSEIAGLEPVTTYYVRAYATNSAGTAYGNQVIFTTLYEWEVYNPKTGKIWMDRNLGATRAATSSTDADAYGHLYQWGRASDGHQLRTSYDWRSPQNDNLWQGVNAVNNPCPAGFRLPTEAELNAERQSWISNDAAGAFASPLKLPVAGYRLSSNGSLSNVDSFGYYWSSNVDGTYSRYLVFDSSNANILSYYQGVRPLCSLP